MCPRPLQDVEVPGRSGRSTRVFVPTAAISTSTYEDIEMTTTSCLATYFSIPAEPFCPRPFELGQLPTFSSFLANISRMGVPRAVFGQHPFENVNMPLSSRQNFRRPMEGGSRLLPSIPECPGARCQKDLRTHSGAWDTLPPTPTEAPQGGLRQQPG